MICSSELITLSSSFSASAGISSTLIPSSRSCSTVNCGCRSCSALAVNVIFSVKPSFYSARYQPDKFSVVVHIFFEKRDRSVVCIPLFCGFQHNGVEIILFGVSGSAKHAAASEHHRQTTFDDERQLFRCAFMSPGGVVVAFPDDLCFLYFLLQWTSFCPGTAAIIIDRSPFHVLSARCRKW